MAEELMAIMNPRRRKRRRSLPPRGRGGRFLSRRSRGRRRKYRRNPFVQGLAAANPRRRRRRSVSFSPSRRRYRRNPAMNLRGLTRDVMGAAIGAAGGVAVDFGMRFMPLTWKTGAFGHLVRGGVSVGLGVLGTMVRGQMGRMLADMGKGALTITVYNAARQYITVPMGLGELTDDEVAQVLNPSPTVYEDLPLLEDSAGMGAYSMGMYDEQLTGMED